MHRELLEALAEMQGACDELDEAVGRISSRHDPFGCLPFALALVTGGIVAGVAARSMPWYWVGLLSVAGTALMLLVLLAFRVISWQRHHPLLAKASKLRHAGPEDDGAVGELLELGEAIVRQYMPPEQAKPLLAKLECAKLRFDAVLGLPEADDRGPR